MLQRWREREKEKSDRLLLQITAKGNRDTGRGEEREQKEKDIREERGAEGDNNMGVSLRGHGGWGTEVWSVIATQGKKASSQLSLCALHSERTPGIG